MTTSKWYNPFSDRAAIRSASRQKDRFHVLNDAADHMSQLLERWENRLILQGQSLVEEYEQGRLTLVCDLDVSMARKWSDASLRGSENPKINSNFLASVVLKAKVTQHADVHDWKQEPMLVNDVEFVQGPEGVIPSVVRFYGIHDEVRDCFGGLMYQSALDGSYKFIPSFSKWESAMVIITPKATENNLINCNVERPLEVVEGISDHERSVSWKSFRFLVAKNIFPSLRGFIDNDVVEVTFLEIQNAVVKVTDVLLGPFDL